MGRDRTRVLVCAAASLMFIIAATLVMDWYRVSFDVGVEEISRVAVTIDLRSMHTCTAVRVCTTTPLSPPGMFSTLATVTLWSSLAFAALVGFQAGVRLLTGNANDTVAKLGYMFALTTISIAIATAYMFGAETDGPGIQIAAHMGRVLERTWAPLTLIIGLILGFATLYMSVAPDSSDLGDTYKPVTLATLRAPPGATAPGGVAPGGMTLAGAPGSLVPGPARPGTVVHGTASPGTAAIRGGEPGERPMTQSLPIPAAARAATRPLRPSGRIGVSSDPLPPSASEIAARSNEQTLPEVSGPPRSNVQTHPTGRMPAAVTHPSGRMPAMPGMPGTRDDAGSGPAAGRQPSGVAPLPATPSGTASGPRARPRTGSEPPRLSTGVGVARHPQTQPVGSAQRPVTGQSPARRTPTGPTPASQRPATGQYPIVRRPSTEPLPGTRRLTTGQVPAAVPPTTARVPVIGPATITSQVPLIEPTPTGQAAMARTKSGPIAPIPEHLRNRLSYVALTAELTGGGIDARREDGTSRLVLWRDVVGIVVRRMPPVFDDALFVDIVSTARSTLRIVPWTRLAGDPIEGEGDARPRAIVEYVLAKCPAAKLDPATRQFLDSGEAAQLPDLETLRAHDARLA